MTAALILAAGAAPAEAQITAEQALSNYRKTFKSTREIDCPRDGAEIVVCGRLGGRDPARLPLPVEREAGTRVAGEVSKDGGGCISRCHQPVQVNILAIPALIGKVIERLKDD
jgi:hypothetical protein